MFATRFNRSSLDPDALAFAAASGATDIRSLSDFVRGIKNLGLWSNMVCWPLRSAQNAGTGTTAYSLGGLGTYNGTLVNGPTWGTDGVSFLGSSSQGITSAYQPFNSAGALGTAFVILSPDSIGTGSVIGTRASGTDAITGWSMDFSAPNLRYFHTSFSPNLSMEATAAGSFRSVGMIKNGLNATLISGTSFGTPTAISGFAPASSGLGIAQTTNNLTGKISLVVLVESALTQPAWTQLRDLAKSTLSQGLGL